VVLNGAPRSGKSSIVSAIQETFEGTWMNLGVDVARMATPPKRQPGVGLRPGEDAHPAAPFVPVLYAALYESVAAHSRLGLNVVVDVGHHQRAVLSDCARRLAGLPVLFVGVICPLDTIMERRRASAPGSYASAPPGEQIPPPVLRWQDEVHAHAVYDLELDTSLLSPEQCAEAIRERLDEQRGPEAFARLADGERSI
jgi:chloramphenicol 3-O phosphotransferase